MFAKLDDRFLGDPQMLDAGDDGQLLLIHGILYSLRHGLGGFVPAGALSLLTLSKRPKKIAARLVDAGLWQQGANGWWVTDWNSYLWPAEPKARGEMRRAWEAMAWKVRPDVLKRDGYRCVQCGATERLEADHITPLALGGTNDMDNLQTLCRPCNASKGAR